MGRSESEPGILFPSIIGADLRTVVKLRQENGWYVVRDPERLEAVLAATELLDKARLGHLLLQDERLACQLARRDEYTQLCRLMVDAGGGVWLTDEAYPTIREALGALFDEEVNQVGVQLKQQSIDTAMGYLEWCVAQTGEGDDVTPKFWELALNSIKREVAWILGNQPQLS